MEKIFEKAVEKINLDLKEKLNNYIRILAQKTKDLAKEQDITLNQAFEETLLEYLGETFYDRVKALMQEKKTEQTANIILMEEDLDIRKMAESDPHILDCIK